MWWKRWRARARINRRVGLWYHRDYGAPELPEDRRILHMQPERVERALARLGHQRLLRPVDVTSPQPARLEDLARVHSQSYLEQVNDPEVLARIFGVVPESVDVEALLSAQRLAVGGTVAAAWAAARGRPRVAFNLGGGFHHARSERGSGFCVFNDVAVAIARLREGGFTAPIAIVDLDFHQGDGNLSIFATDPTVLVYSVHGATWASESSAACRNYALPSGTTDRDYLACLDETLRPALATHNTALVFYIAGVDVLAGDQLGDFGLSARGVLARDRRVIYAAELLRAPVVVTLAGGYSPGAWQCTANFIRWLLCDERRVDREPLEKLRREYHSVARELDPFELQRDEEAPLADSDLLPGRGRRPQRLLLDFYSSHGIELALERYHLLDRARAAGYTDPRVRLVLDDPGAQALRVEGVPVATGGDPVLLVELVLSRRVVPAPEALGGASVQLPVLRVEWLLLQDPLRPFSAMRPKLPGQMHPGLGLLHETHQLLIQVCLRLRLEAIVYRPAHYHNAVVAAREYRFVDPQAEGRFRAMRRVLANLTLPAATQEVEARHLALADGAAVAWEPAELMVPVSERVRDYFSSKDYIEKSKQACERLLEAGLHLAAGGSAESDGITRPPA